MKKSVEKVLICKGDRTSGLQITAPGTTATYIAEGEVTVLDKNKNIMTAGATIADSDVIYVVEGTSETFSYVNEAGTTTTSARRLRYSDPIQASAVTVYSGTAYDAPKEAIVTIDGSTFTPVVGDVYKIRVVYKDMFERPGQYTRTYQFIATDTDPDTVFAAIAALINADKIARVTATVDAVAHTLTITGKVTEDDTEVTSISGYLQVNPKVFLYSDNFDTATVTYSTNPSPGSGTWKQVRDEEKWSQGYVGQTNRTKFPVIGPTFRTVKDQEYNTIVINHKNWYTAPDRYEKQVDITTKIFIPVSSTQNAALLAVLNPWMASIEKGFDNISF
jgi:hypothetical protein